VKRNYLTEIKKSISVKSYKFKYLPKEYVRPFDFINIDKNSYVTLIRFPDVNEGDFKNGIMLNTINSIEKRCYKFSPLQIIKITPILREMEAFLHFIYNLHTNE